MKAFQRKLVLLMADILVTNATVVIALLLRFDSGIPGRYLHNYISSMIFVTIIKILIYNHFHLYSSIWKYASIDELLQVFYATLTGSLASIVFGFMFSMHYPKSVYITSWMLTFLFVGGIRLSYRIVRRAKMYMFHGFSDNNKRKALIIGAGSAGSMVIKQLKFQQDSNSIPVAIIDDDVRKHHAQVHGVPVKGGRDKILKVVEEEEIDEIIMALPATAKQEMKKILSICTQTKCKLKTLPPIHEIVNGEVDIKQIRDVNIDDLLGREEIVLNTSEISGYIQDEIVLVTGGGGSIGSELCRQIAKFGPKKLLILDIYENSAYDLQNELKYLYRNQLDLEVLIGSVQDRVRLDYIFSTYRPGIVFHAAAHKHVPLMEASPTEAIKNNVFGTLNTAEFADQYGAKKFVLISTDKAVNPTNIMGATKRVAEMIVQNMSKRSKTEFVAVRFGNVLGSNGSVIPLFQKQIEQGGPITVTHPEITRFFMTIPEAAQLVIQAGAMAKGGEIFILDMGQPVKIADLAKDLIRLSGLEPNVDIKIEFTGLRPGEKLYEELLMAEEGLTATKHQKIFVGKPIYIDYKFLMKELANLTKILTGSREEILSQMSRIVPTYSSSKKEENVG